MAVGYTILMSPHHPLASDADASDQEVGHAQAECSFALGRLDGLLSGLSADENALFCMKLLRETSLSALMRAGFGDAELRFDSWFSGLDRGPEETALTSCSAYAIVRALLSELGRHPLQPLAEAAQTVARAARFVTDRPMNSSDQLPINAVRAASKLIAQANAGAENPLPFAGLSLLSNLLLKDPIFAPLERETGVLSFGGRDVLIERSAFRTPLWAVDALLGSLLGTKRVCHFALPFPNAVSVEALGAHLWPNERSILEARTLAASTNRLLKMIEMSKREVNVMRKRLAHLRSSARAPQVWIALAGFAPLSLGQLAAAFRVSRRGTYAVRDTIVAAGLATCVKIKGKLLLVAETSYSQIGSSLTEQTGALRSSALAEFNAAMADVERLLERNHHLK